MFLVLFYSNPFHIHKTDILVLEALVTQSDISCKVKLGIVFIII